MGLFNDEAGHFQISCGDDRAGNRGAGDFYDDCDDGGDGGVKKCRVISDQWKRWRGRSFFRW